MPTLAQAFRERFIGSHDTVALFSEPGADVAPKTWPEEWRGRLIDWFNANDIAARDDVLAVTRDLKASGSHRMGGGAAPIFELRLIAQSL
jgi:hypothetical protein